VTLLPSGCASQHCDTSSANVQTEATACVPSSQTTASQVTTLDRHTLFVENGRLRDFYFGYTSLICHAYAGDVSAIEKDLVGGAEVNWRMQWGLTALHWAADQGHAEAVTALLDGGAEINTPCEEGLTALMLAARENRSAVVEVLLQRGADRTLRDGHGHTAADHARLAGHIALAKRLATSDNSPR
jgi:ankyrin repeat protein